MRKLVLLVAACSFLGTAVAQQAAPAPEPADVIVFEEALPPGDVLFNVPVVPPDVVMMAGTPAPEPPPFAWQGEAGQRMFLRMPHHGPELGKWWKDSKIVAELKLTPAQVSQVEQTFYDHRLKLIDLRADLEREETRLQPLMEADQVDEAKVSAQIDLVLAARGRLEKANTMMMLALRRSLSVEQWKKLEGIKQEREQRWGGHPAMAPMPARPAHPPHPPQPATTPAPPKPGDRM
jgi:Spy/CpxP family protein refolding chaperone